MNMVAVHYLPISPLGRSYKARRVFREILKIGLRNIGVRKQVRFALHSFVIDARSTFPIFVHKITTYARAPNTVKNNVLFS